jgi:O-antigen ligase
MDVQVSLHAPNRQVDSPPIDYISTPRRERGFDLWVTPSFEPSGPSLVAALGGPKLGSKGPPLPAQEAALVGVVTTNLLFLPWALGSMHVWSQLVSLGLSATGLLVAMLPRKGVDPANNPRARLLRFPMLWAGIIAVAYVAIQGLNPASRFVSDSQSWWLIPVPHNPLLPSGVDAPYARSNPWRSMVIFGSVWILACSVWSGFLRRQSYRLMFSAVAFGGALLAVVGLIQQMTGSGQIFWGYKAPEKAQFMASFIYKNHAGAYFNLVLALATGLAGWHWRRAQRRIEGPGRAIAFGFAAALIGTAVIFSASRMSIVLLVAFTLMVALGPAFRALCEPGRRHQRGSWAVIALSATCILGIGLVSFEANSVWKRFAALVASPTATLRARTIAREAAGNMLRDRWILGWGAGCFRYGFPLYAQHYPEIYVSASHGRQYWEHAHDDLLEFPLELGAVGMIPIAFMLGFAGWCLLSSRFWRNPVSFCAAAGCLLTLAHAWVDFVFQNPAVTASWAVLLIGAIRWAELESSFDRRRIIP